jgi:glycosyltransferase involved in cell wall biosynthesis
MDVIYGSALWHSATKVNCHFVAERLAAQCPVLFVESVGARSPRPHEWRRVVPRLLRSFRPVRRVADGLWVLSPLPLPMFRGAGARLNSRWVGLQVAAVLRVRRWRADMCWVFHPMGLGTAVRCQPRAVVYYCVDDYAVNPGVDAAAVRSLERELIGLAAVTVTTGAPLARRLGSSPRRLEILPNVVDTDLFAQDGAGAAHPTVKTLDRIPRPRVGYVGNVAAYKIDLGLIREIAERRPGWSVTLVGPRDYGDTRATVSALALPSNVHFLEPVPHATVPAVIDRFDVCLLPAPTHDLTLASFPLKFFEYLLRGRPVVGRPVPALEPYREWYREAGSAMEFVEAIEEALDDDGDEIERRRRFAATFSWNKRAAELRTLRQTVLDESL